MLRIISCLSLLLPLLCLVSAQCDSACSSYNDALKACQGSSNVTALGTKMDSKTVNCMCTSKSNESDMNACLGCNEQNLTIEFDYIVSNAWITTCKADVQFGDQQAALCWQGQPTNYLPCVSKTTGSGSSGGGTSGGGAGTTTGSSAGPTGSGSRYVSRGCPMIYCFWRLSANPNLPSQTQF